MTDEWRPALDELRARRAAAQAMGGADRLEKQRAGGKLDARARIDRLLDPGTFQEMGTLAGGTGVPADAVVTGWGQLAGRPVMVAAEDFTVLAGTISAVSNAKRYRIADLAVRDRIPLVMLLDGAGYRAVSGGAHVRTPTDLIAQARCSGRVPVVTAILGASAGHGALIAPMSDFVVMSAHASVFTAGPPVVLESLGERVNKHELGGPDVALASGLVHNLAADDEHALDLVRGYLSYFPSSAWGYPMRETGDHAAERRTDDLLDIVPRNGRRAYDMQQVLRCVLDSDSIFEVQPAYGRSVICALARLGGHPVAVVANQPSVRAGAVDADSADKAAHFIGVADSFHLPLIFLADNPGMLPGSLSERQGVLRSGARMFAAQSGATTPKLHITLRKAYGFGSMVMAMISFDGQDASYAFPGATFGAMGAAAMTRASRADADEAAALAEAELDASFRSGETFGTDEIIAPGETRVVLLRTLERALHARQKAAEPVARIGIPL